MNTFDVHSTSSERERVRWKFMWKSIRSMDGELIVQKKWNYIQSDSKVNEIIKKKLVVCARREANKSWIKYLSKRKSKLPEGTYKFFISLPTNFFLFFLFVKRGLARTLSMSFEQYNFLIHSIAAQSTIQNRSLSDNPRMLCFFNDKITYELNMCFGNKLPPYQLVVW